MQLKLENLGAAFVDQVFWYADYFATWCNGCQRSYPELCKLAMDPDLNKHVKFIKVH